MGLRRIIVLLVAVVVAGATAMYARSWIEGQQVTAAPVPIETPQEEYEVLVADTAIPAGTFVKPQHLRWQSWPTDDVPDTYVLKGSRSRDVMIGAVARRGIAEGFPVTDGAVVKPGERGFLAAVLQPGMRAVSLPINATSSNSGLIFPGDRVDLILTQTLGGEDGSTRRVSETVLRDIRIIAMGAETSDEVDEGKNHEKAKTATFEVEPRIAEKVALLTELGRLSLSLRSLAHTPADEGPLAGEENSYTWDLDVSRVLRNDQRLLVLRGSDAENVQLQQGAN